MSTITTTDRPVTVGVNFDNIPQALRDKVQWIVWKWTWKKDQGKWAKVPRDIGNTETWATWSDKATWADYGTACKVYEQTDMDGIGFILSESDIIAGIDLDDCRDPETEEIAEWAQAIIDHVDSYTEVSPSGAGVKVYLKGVVPGGKGRRTDKPHGIEVYDRGRFFAVTGNHLQGTPKTVELRSKHLLDILGRYFPENSKPSAPPAAVEVPEWLEQISDERLIEIASGASNGERFKALWGGDIDTWKSLSAETNGNGDYSPSAADLALVSMLAFYARDPLRIDRLFRMSDLCRDKWDRDDYRDATISKALENRTEFFTPADIELHNGRGDTGNGPTSTSAPETANRVSGPVSVSRTSIQSDRARNEFHKAIPLSACGGGDTITWPWYGYLAAEHTTLFTGLWKAGKTTLMSYLLRDFGSGGNIAGQVTPGKVLVVTEESRGLWARRRDDLRIGDHVCIDSRPFMGRPNNVVWRLYIEHLARQVRDDGYKIVVFDTISAVWPVDDENKAAVVLSALAPLNLLTAQGAAVLLIHHPRKGDGTEGQAARGSGALTGFVDIIMELRRYKPEDPEDRRRSIRALSRFDETNAEVVLELSPDGYKTVGTKSDAKRADRLEVIGGILRDDGNPRTAEDILLAWPTEGPVKPRKRAIQMDLNDGRDKGLWTQTGLGTKGDPYRFSVA